MKKLTIEDLKVEGKRVLMRVDFNVPLEGGKVANDKRIRAALPTIKHIVAKGGKLILMSHLGRPKGQRVPEMSLKACVPVLSDLLGKPVGFVADCRGEEVKTAVEKLTPSKFHICWSKDALQAVRCETNSLSNRNREDLRIFLGGQ